MKRDADFVNIACTRCGGRMQVKDSRPANYQGRQSIRRRRCCGRCAFRVTTYEIIDDGEAKADLRLSRLIGGIRRAHDALAALIEQFDAKPDGNGINENETKKRQAREVRFS